MCSQTLRACSRTVDPVYFTFPDVKKIGVCDKSRLPTGETAAERKREREKERGGEKRGRKRAITRRLPRLRIPADSRHCVTKCAAGLRCSMYNDAYIMRNELLLLLALAYAGQCESMFSSVPIVLINISCVMRYFIFYMLSIFIYSCTAPGIVISRHAVNNIGMIFLFSIPNFGYFGNARNRAACFGSDLPPRSAGGYEKRKTRARESRKKSRKASLHASAEGALVVVSRLFAIPQLRAAPASRRSSKPAPRRLLAERVIGAFSRAHSRALSLVYRYQAIVERLIYRSR